MTPVEQQTVAMEYIEMLTQINDQRRALADLQQQIADSRSELGALSGKLEPLVGGADDVRIFMAGRRALVVRWVGGCGNCDCDDDTVEINLVDLGEIA